MNSAHKRSITFLNRFFLYNRICLACKTLNTVLSKGMYSTFRKIKIFLIKHTSFDITVKEPANIQLSINKTCNLQCTFCARQTSHIREQLASDANLEMQIEFLKKNSGLFKEADYINLAADGEPLFHPEIKNIIETISAASKKNNIIFVTNGTLFTDDLIDSIVRSRIMEVHFSIDSLDRENSQFIRPGADMDRIIDSIKKINEKKKKLTSTFPVLVMRPTFISQTIGELPSMIDFCAKHGFSSILVQNMQIYKKELAEYSLVNSKELVRNNISMAKDKGWQCGVEVVLDAGVENIEQQDPDSILIDLDNTDAEPDGINDHDIMVADLTKKCVFPWDFMLVQTNGDVYPCCFSMYLLGNLYEETWEDIWNGPRAVALRKKFKKNILPKECVNKPCGIGRV